MLVKKLSRDYTNASKKVLFPFIITYYSTHDSFRNFTHKNKTKRKAKPVAGIFMVTPTVSTWDAHTPSKHASTYVHNKILHT